MADICTDVLVLVLAFAEIPLRVSSAVCKRWRKVLLIDRMVAIRAQLPTATIKEIIDLPALFYSDLTIMQQLLLPNELFDNSDVTLELRKYNRYKFPVSWADVQESEYIKVILDMYVRAGIKIFPANNLAYSRHLFRYSIQYRHYLMVISGISAATILEYVKTDPPCEVHTKSVKLAWLCRCIWKYGKHNVPTWQNIIWADYLHTKKFFG